MTYKVAILGQDTYENVNRVKKHIYNWKENFYDKLEIVSGGGRYGSGGGGAGALGGDYGNNGGASTTSLHGAGGGGAGAVGQDYTSGNSGNGGAGIANPISGSTIGTKPF